MKRILALILIALGASSPLFGGPIEDYQFYGLTWENTVSQLLIKFPKAVKSSNAYYPKPAGVEEWGLSNKYEDIGFIDRAYLSFYRNRLYSFKLTYERENWKTIYTRLSRQFGEPDVGFQQKGYTSIYRWSSPTSKKTIFLIPPQNERLESVTTVEFTDFEAKNAIPKDKKPGPGF